MRRWSAALVILMLLQVLAACSATAYPSSTAIRIAGSSSMSPLLQALADAYSARHPSVPIELEESNSGVGLELLRNGAVDLAAVSWKEEEFTAQYPRLEWHAVASDAIAVIVHPRNELEDVTREEIGRLFAGWYAEAEAES